MVYYFVGRDLPSGARFVHEKERGLRMLDEMKVLSRIAPDLMADIGRRAQVLSSIESMQPVGRRALAARLNLPEREVRGSGGAEGAGTHQHGRRGNAADFSGD